MVDADLLTAFVLDFAAAATTILRQKDRSKLPPAFQIFLVSLIWAGLCAGFIALYYFVRTEGWVLGIVLWFTTGIVSALVAVYIGKTSDDTLVVRIRTAKRA